MKAAELNAMHEKAKHCEHVIFQIDDNGKVQCDNCSLTGYLRWERVIPDSMTFVDSPTGVQLVSKQYND